MIRDENHFLKAQIGECSQRRWDKAQAGWKRQLGLAIEKRMFKGGQSRAMAVLKASRALSRGASEAELFDDALFD